MNSLRQQLEELFPQVKIVRRLRRIVDANVFRGYNVENYVEYSDGTHKMTHTSSVSQDKTSVRLRECSIRVWEESVPGAPGWFRCDPPDWY